jgi:hypothetical protein
MSQSNVFGYLVLFFVIGGVAVTLQTGSCVYLLPILVVLGVLLKMVNGSQGGGKKRKR